MKDVKTADQLRELLKDRAAFVAWFKALPEEDKQMLETILAEVKAEAEEASS